MKILAIETSCDETSVAVVQERKVLSNIIKSQIADHTPYGGIIPEIASREHVKHIIPVLDNALKDANITLEQIDAIAVTEKPGLLGSLLVGISAAKTLALLLKKPLYLTDHLYGHLYSTWLYENDEQPEDFPFPILYLTVSGGHTILALMKKHGTVEYLGKTRDDAAGEAYDKVSYLLGGPYPGGPFIDNLAKQGNPQTIKFPRAMTNQHNYDFSFSGLKTAVAVYLKNPIHSEIPKANIAASFQEAVVDSLLDKLKKASEEYHPALIMLAGGVSANSRLREKAKKIFPTNLRYPKLKWCTDNAAMIGCAAYFTHNK